MDIGELVPALAGGGWKARLREWLHRALGVYEVHALFSRARDAEAGGGMNVFLGVLDGRDMALDGGDIRARIPRNGPAVVVANHAFGGADAIALSGVCAEVRADTRVLANAMSADLPGTSKWTIPLHIMGETGATVMNRQAMKAALGHLRAGGLLVVFPAGAVSRWRNDLGRIADPEWSPHVARLARKAGAPVLPVRFFGRNPLWLELLGAVHPLLRSALIVRAFLVMRGNPVRFRAGGLLGAEELASVGTAGECTRLMRDAVESVDDPA